MRKSEAITVWCDESSVEVVGEKYHLIGTLITNSDTEELIILDELIKARKRTGCWNVLHGNELKSSAVGRMSLIKEWVGVFNGNKIYFHVFMYKEDRTFAVSGFERYFAKQSAFSLGCKMKKNGYTIETIFSNVGTVKFLFDRRTGDIESGLDSEYKKEIKEQLRNRSGRSDDLTVRFSFLSSECFDLMQLCDVFLYAVKVRIEKENGIPVSDNNKGLLKIWESNFLNNQVRALSDFKYDEKFNFFRSNSGD
ncbi:hypothetical protein ACFL3M_03145 [Patescibacteria group bacterium]